MGFLDWAEKAGWRPVGGEPADGGSLKGNELCRFLIWCCVREVHCRDPEPQVLRLAALDQDDSFFLVRNWLENKRPDGGWLAFVVSHPSSKKTLDGWGTRSFIPLVPTCINQRKNV